MSGQAIAFARDTGAPLDEAQAAEAIAAGQAGFLKNATVYMRSPNGDEVSMSADDAQSAIADGYEILPSAYVAQKQQEEADRERYGGALQTAGAAAEGAANALSFGGYDVAATELGLDTAKRAEVNPTARTLGEVGGTVGSLLIPGGAAAKGAGTLGKAARLATAAPRALARGAEALGAHAGAATARALGEGLTGRLLSKGAQLAVSGGAEGAAYGAGQVISEAALRDQELTAEMLLSGALEGATLGGLTGGALGLGTGALGETGRAIGRRLGKGGNLESFANKEAALHMLGGSKRELGKVLGKGGMDRLERLGARSEHDAALLSNPAKALEVVNREAADSVSRLKRVQSQLDEAGTRIERAGLASQIDDQIAKAGTGLTGDAVAVGRGLIDQLKPIRTRLADNAAGDLSFSEAWDMRRALDEVIDYDKRNPTMLGAALKETRANISKSLDDAAESLAPELKDTWKKANADYSDWATIRTVMKTRAEKDLGKSLVQSGDTLSAAAGVASGLATGSTLTGLATGALLGGANRLVRERGHEFLSRAARSLSKMDETIDGAARSLVGQKVAAARRIVAPVAVSLAHRYEQARQDAVDSGPQALQARMAQAAQGLENHPGLLTSIHTGVAADAAYLQSQLPQTDPNSPSNSLTPTKPQLPSKLAMKDFVSKSEALKNPAGVMADVAAGDVDLAAIEALKVRRPKIYQDMRKRVMMYAAERGEELPYSQRVTLSLAFDFTADPSMEPANMAAIQASFVPPEPTEQPGQPKPPGPSRKLEGGKEAGKAMTLPTDRAAM